VTTDLVHAPATRLSRHLHLQPHPHSRPRGQQPGHARRCICRHCLRSQRTTAPKAAVGAEQAAGGPRPAAACPLASPAPAPQRVAWQQRPSVARAQQLLLSGRTGRRWQQWGRRLPGVGLQGVPGLCVGELVVGQVTGVTALLVRRQQQAAAAGLAAPGQEGGGAWQGAHQGQQGGSGSLWAAEIQLQGAG
jgi:hypothetical protein